MSDHGVSRPGSGHKRIFASIKQAIIRSDKETSKDSVRQHIVVLLMWVNAKIKGKFLTVIKCLNRKANINKMTQAAKKFTQVSVIYIKSIVFRKKAFFNFS